jgi:hypothetical protein
VLISICPNDIISYPDPEKLINPFSGILNTLFENVDVKKPLGTLTSLNE